MKSHTHISIAEAKRLQMCCSTCGWVDWAPFLNPLPVLCRWTQLYLVISGEMVKTCMFISYLTLHGDASAPSVILSISGNCKPCQVTNKKQTEPASRLSETYAVVRWAAHLCSLFCGVWGIKGFRAVMTCNIRWDMHYFVRYTCWQTIIPSENCGHHHKRVHQWWPHWVGIWFGDCDGGYI